MSCPKHNNDISLTKEELALLEVFREEPFLPVARRSSSPAPSLCLDGADLSETLMWLQLKGLVDVDFSSPLTNYEYSEYPVGSIRGSASLSLRGQEALDTIDILGVAE